MTSFSSRSITQRVATYTGVIALLGLNACASTTPVAYKGLSSTPELTPTKESKNAFQYKNPDIQSEQYTNLIIDPVTVYSGEDSQFGSVSPKDRAKIAEYMQQQFKTVFGKNVNIVETAVEPGTARLHLTLTGMQTSTPVVSALSHILPVGLVVNAGLGAAGHSGTFFGSISYAAEVYDAATGELKYASVSRQTPFAMDVTASFGRLDAAKKGVRSGAQHLNQDLSKTGLFSPSDSI
jgi:hypothetical protein